MKYKNKAIYLISAIWISIAFFMDYIVVSEKEIVQTSGIMNPHLWFKILWDLKISLTNGYSVMTLFVVTGVYFVCRKAAEYPKTLGMILLSAMFAFFQVFGRAFNMEYSWDLLFHSGRNILKTIIMFSGYFLFFLCVISVLYSVLENITVTRNDSNEKSWFTANRKSILAVMGIILLLWLPYIVVSFPGLTNQDVFDMLCSFYGKTSEKYRLVNYSLRSVNLIDPKVTMNNNNPVLQTLIVVFFMKIGTILGNPNIGLFSFCITQTIIFAFVLSYVIYYLAKNNISSKIRTGLVLLYGLVPMHPNYAFTTLKDTNYAFTTVIYILMIIELIRNPKNKISSPKWRCGFGFISLLLILLRNNGLYMVGITSVVLLIAYRKEWKKFIWPAVLPCVIYVVIISNIIFPLFKIAPGSKREAYSIPFQQTARLVKYHKEFYDEEDKEIIDKVLDYDRIAGLYLPYKSDPVKVTYRKNCTSKEFADYLGVWFKGLLRYPNVYVEATMSNCYGYFYPASGGWISYARISEQGKLFGVQSPKFLYPIREEMILMIYLIRNIPGIGMVTSIGFHSWILIFNIAYLCYKKKKKYILMMVPILALLLTSIAGPVNAMMRYIYPLILMVPIYTVLMIKFIKDDEDESFSNNSSV